MRKATYNLTIGVLILSIFTGCGNNTSKINSTSASKTYQVADGYLVGATAFLDLNHDGIYTIGDPITTTKKNGFFSFPNATAKELQSPVIVVANQKTIDQDTNKTILIPYTLAAPAGYHFISPLTSLISSKMDANKSLNLSLAENQVANDLNMSVSQLKMNFMDKSNGHNIEHNLAKLIVKATQQWEQNASIPVNSQNKFPRVLSNQNILKALSTNIKQYENKISNINNINAVASSLSKILKTSYSSVVELNNAAKKMQSKYRKSLRFKSVLKQNEFYYCVVPDGYSNPPIYAIKLTDDTQGDTYLYTGKQINPLSYQGSFMYEFSKNKMLMSGAGAVITGTGDETEALIDITPNDGKNNISFISNGNYNAKVYWFTTLDAAKKYASLIRPFQGILVDTDSFEKEPYINIGLFYSIGDNYSHDIDAYLAYNRYLKTKAGRTDIVSAVNGFTKMALLGQYFMNQGYDIFQTEKYNLNSNAGNYKSLSIGYSIISDGNKRYLFVKVHITKSMSDLQNYFYDTGMFESSIFSLGGCSLNLPLIKMFDPKIAQKMVNSYCSKVSGQPLITRG